MPNPISTPLSLHGKKFRELLSNAGVQNIAARYKTVLALFMTYSNLPVSSGDRRRVSNCGGVESLVPADSEEWDTTGPHGRPPTICCDSLCTSRTRYHPGTPVEGRAPGQRHVWLVFEAMYQQTCENISLVIEEDSIWNIPFPFDEFGEREDHAPYMKLQRHVPTREVLPEVGSSLTLEFIPDSDGIERQ